MANHLSSKDRATDLGSIKINNDAVATIASVAAMEVKGVTRMGGSLGKTLYEILFRRATSRGVRIVMQDGEAKLTVSVVVEYGIDIPRVADEVQDNVKRAVEKMSGLVLSEVDVVVEGVYAPSAAGEKNPLNR